MAKLFAVVGITRHVAVAGMPAITLDNVTDGYRLARTFLSQIHLKTLGNFALKARNWLDAVGCRLHLCELPLSSHEQVDLIAGSEPCRLSRPGNDGQTREQLANARRPLTVYRERVR